MGQTITEKVVQSHSEGLSPGHEVRAGDMVTVRPFHVMTHDNTGAVMPKFQAIGAKRIADPSQPVFTLDHNVQDTSEENLAKYGRIQEFADSQGVAFFPAGAGIGHQLMQEAIRRATERGARLIQLTSDKNRQDALRFYESLGFRATHEGFKLTLTASQGH